MGRTSLKVLIEQAECPESPTGRHISLIHNEHNGEGEEVCYYCKRVKKAITELELYQGMPIDPYATGRLKELRVITGKMEKRGNGDSHDKERYYTEHYDEMKADWDKGGRDLVMQNHPIQLSTLRQKEKLWGWVPDTDRRKDNRFHYRPNKKQADLRSSYGTANL